MSNFHPKLEESTEAQLLHSINEHNPHFASLSSDELTRRALTKLNSTIVEANQATSRYSDAILILTVMMLILGLLQLAVATLKMPESQYLRLTIFLILVSFLGAAGYFILREILRKDR